MVMCFIVWIPRWSARHVRIYNWHFVGSRFPEVVDSDNICWQRLSLHSHLHFHHGNLLTGEYLNSYWLWRRRPRFEFYLVSSHETMRAGSHEFKLWLIMITAQNVQLWLEQVRDKSCAEEDHCTWILISAAVMLRSVMTTIITND